MMRMFESETLAEARELLMVEEARTCARSSTAVWRHYLAILERELAHACPHCGRIEARR